MEINYKILRNNVIKLNHKQEKLSPKYNNNKKDLKRHIKLL